MAKASSSPLRDLVPTSRDTFLVAASVVPGETIETEGGPQARLIKLAHAASLSLGEKDKLTYANIKLIMPDRSNDALKPSGKFVRAKDRSLQSATSKDGSAGGYRRMEQPAENNGDLGATKIHVGRCKGLELRDLSAEQVGALVEKWLPTAKENPKPLADDKRLVAALEWWQTEHAVTATDDAADNVPY